MAHLGAQHAHAPDEKDHEQGAAERDKCQQRGVDDHDDQIEQAGELREQGDGEATGKDVGELLIQLYPVGERGGIPLGEEPGRHTQQVPDEPRGISNDRDGEEALQAA